MPSLFSRLKTRDGKAKSKKNADLAQLNDQNEKKPQWDDAWTRKTVEAEEVQELIRRCTGELKSRGLDLPFLLLPFRPASDPSAVRSFVRHFFDGQQMTGDALAQELRMTEPMVISGVVKWCWSRLQGGVVGWDSYELFKVGEQDSNMARDSFKTFIPLSIENEARTSIVFDFFDLLSAIAAHGKINGFGGRKLSRMAGWWAFEHVDTGNGFEGGYKAWLSAADATSHLFFAYLRSLSPQPSRGGISMLPMSLEKLLAETEYPPERPSLMESSTNKVVMIVDAVSPTPFALLRRANHFQYRDEDRALSEWSEYEDPVQALTEECRRVLRAISAANQSQAVSSSKHSTSIRDVSWSRFEDIGFAGAAEDDDEYDEPRQPFNQRRPPALRTTPASGNGLARPTTPSWADFLSSGFVDDSLNSSRNLLLPPDKILPPIETTVRQRSSQSHKPRLESERHLEPGELASITRFDLDDAFWWVWMSSLAPEETPERKSAFGRCAVIETVIHGGRWLVMEEMVKGAAPEPEAGAYIAEKKGFFSWTRRNRGGVVRRKSTGKQGSQIGDSLKPSGTMGFSKTSIGPDQQAKIQAAAQQLQARQMQESKPSRPLGRRGRTDAELMAEKTNSVLTLQPSIMHEASPAVQWANKYDKETIREAYLANATIGRGLANTTMQSNGHSASNGQGRPEVPAKSPSPLPVPAQSPAIASASSPVDEEVQPAGLTEKELESPQDLHPINRRPVANRGILAAAAHPAPYSPPAPPAPPAPPTAPAPLAKNSESIELPRENMGFSDAQLSPESRKRMKKLHKEKEKEMRAGGLRNLFGRNKKRQSKLPDSSADRLQAMGVTEDRSTAPTPEPTKPERPTIDRQETQFVTPMEQPEDLTLKEMPTPSPAHVAKSMHEDEESVSRIDTADAAEAHDEFSRFDQGPMSDQPAFVPEGDDEDEGVDDNVDDALPPPIARHASRSPQPSPQAEPEEGELTPKLLPAQDRWAQIRKNAAERAAMLNSEEANRGRYSKATTEGDDDTSGEETIESRVARIKARVAELTGNMEGGAGGSSAGSRTPPVRR